MRAFLPALLLLLARGASSDRGMCTYNTLNRAGGRWRVPSHCTHLYLTQVQFGAAGARQLGEALASNLAAVTAVDASSCGIGGAGALAVGAGVAANTALVRLNLGNNRLGDSGTVALADGLAANTGLRALNLAHNRIGPRGAAALAEALRRNRGLTSLDLDLNRLHDAGAVALAAALRENDSLVTLVLAGNQIGNVGAAALAEALTMNQGLRRVSLKYNRISGEGARLLAEAALANGRVSLAGPQFLGHTIQRLQRKRAALQAPRNATRLLEVAAMYDSGALSAHKLADRHAQALCMYRLAAAEGGTAGAAAERAAAKLVTPWGANAQGVLRSIGQRLGARCGVQCELLAEEVCRQPHAEAAGPIVTHGERKKRWLRREPGSPYHATRGLDGEL